MAKIAVELEQALAAKALTGAPGTAVEHVLARGRGWKTADVLCTSGPQDRAFEERHDRYSIAIVAAGTFQYRSSSGRAVMTPGSLLLGSAGNHFECGHQHATGDRCIAFQFERGFFEELVAGLAPSQMRRWTFATTRIPPLRETAPLLANVLACLSGDIGLSWEELAFQVAGRAVQLSTGASTASTASTVLQSAEARVTRVVRHIERHPDQGLALEDLAKLAGLSPYHFLRVFEHVTGVTPHQYILRARLRESAERLVAGSQSVLNVALDSGFPDVSNFNRTFRAEFAVTPRQFRRGGTHLR